MSEQAQQEQAASARLRLALLRRRERFERERAAWRPPAAPMHMSRHRRGRQ